MIDVIIGYDDGNKIAHAARVRQHGKVRLWIAEINEWRVKKKLSTFFPDDWTQQRVHEELAIAFENKKFQGGNAYDGTMSNGVKIRFHIENGVIKSAYPNFKI